MTAILRYLLSLTFLGGLAAGSMAVSVMGQSSLVDAEKLEPQGQQPSTFHADMESKPDFVRYTEPLQLSEAAQQALIHAMLHLPNRAVGLAQLGNLRLAEGRIVPALNAFISAHHLGMKDIDLAKTIAELHVANRDYEAASQWYETIARHDNVAPDDLIRLAQLHLEAGDLEASAAFAQSILQRESDQHRLHEQAHWLLAEIAWRQDRVEEAVQWWEAACDARSCADASILQYLGMYFYREGDNEKAVDYLTRYLELESDDRRAASMLAAVLKRTHQPELLKDILLCRLERYGRDRIFIDLASIFYTIQR